jgi:hypothetical protein
VYSAAPQPDRRSAYRRVWCTGFAN